MLDVTDAAPEAAGGNHDAQGEKQHGGGTGASGLVFKPMRDHEQ